MKPVGVQNPHSPLFPERLTATLFRVIRPHPILKACREAVDEVEEEAGEVAEADLEAAMCPRWA